MCRFIGHRTRGLLLPASCHGLCSCDSPSWALLSVLRGVTRSVTRSGLLGPLPMLFNLLGSHHAVPAAVPGSPNAPLLVCRATGGCGTTMLGVCPSPVTGIVEQLLVAPLAIVCSFSVHVLCSFPSLLICFIIDLQRFFLGAWH